MLQTLRNAWGIAELRKKLIFTMLILLVYRIGNAIPVPFVDVKTLSEFFDATLSTTILGLLPLIWAKDQPGGELLAPLAIVQFGGLVSATILNLLVMPATCKIFARFMTEVRE